MVLGLELIVFLDNLASLVIDEHIVQVSQVGQVADQMILILRIFDPILLCEFISKDVKDLQVLEFDLFLRSLAEVAEELFESAYLVVAYGEHVEFGALIQPFKYSDTVIVEREVCEIDEVIEPLNLTNVVEAQVEPLEVGQVIQILNLFDDVVV